MAKYIMALDAGTTSNRCILFNESGEMCSVSQREFPQYFPKPGWVEHDANEIWATQLGVAVEAMQKIGATAADIAAIGITNQRETAIVWDKVTGEPIHHAIVWQCRRTSEYCDSLKAKGLTDSFRAKTGLVTTIAWGLNGKVEYALEGSVFVAGAAIQWLRDELKIIESAPDSEYYAGKVKDTNGCYVVPAFTGLGAPHWDQYARGTIVGITRGVNKNHIIRATMESLAYQVNDILVAMQADSGIKLAALNVDGGASANNLLMQMQSDISGAPVQRPTCVETTAMGAAYLAGLAVGYWASKEDVVRNRAIDRVFHPEITAEERAAKVKGWSKAVKCSYGWAKDE